LKKTTKKGNDVMIRYILLFAFISIVAFTSMTCHSPTEPPGNGTFTLTLSDTSCTEAWLKVHLGGAFGSRTVEITRGSTVVLTLKLSQTDTTIADTGLLPNRAYTYVAELTNGTVKSTDPLYVRTLDTTSGSFTFQTYTLGGAASSMLNDVAIINDTLAYAVGLIYGYDSTGQVDQQPYNLAVWNGQNWKLQKVPYYYQGQAFYSSVNSIIAFSANDIWLEAGIHWDGHQFNSIPLNINFPSHVNRMWGTSSKDLYIVGNGGLIAHSNGSTWTQIPSGTTLDIRDIWGGENKTTGSMEIYATAGNPLIGPANGIIQISGTTAQAISTVGIGGGLNGLWFSPGRYYWIVGDGVWEKHPTLNAASWSMQPITRHTIDAVCGNGINDVFMCGAYGEFLHFNGVSRRSYQSEVGIPGAYFAIAVHGNTVIAVGEEPPYAVVLIGKRS
jgi:hypothetical protein